MRGVLGVHMVRFWDLKETPPFAVSLPGTPFHVIRDLDVDRERETGGAITINDWIHSCCGPNEVARSASITIWPRKATDHSLL